MVLVSNAKPPHVGRCLYVVSVISDDHHERRTSPPMAIEVGNGEL